MGCLFCWLFPLLYRNIFLSWSPICWYLGLVAGLLVLNFKSHRLSQYLEGNPLCILLKVSGFKLVFYPVWTVFFFYKIKDINPISPSSGRNLGLSTPLLGRLFFPNYVIAFLLIIESHSFAIEFLVHLFYSIGQY